MLKNPWVLTGLLGVVLFGGAILFSGGPAVTDDFTSTDDGEVVIQSHITGNPDAAVKLVEYSDFQCPACQRFEPIMEQVLVEYGDQLSFEYKHFPLSIHPFAMQAAVAAEAAAQQGKFFEYYTKLFQNQQTWSAASSPNLFFIQYATELGLDVEQFKKQMTSATLRDKKVKADQAEAIALSLGGTPTFLLNGEQMKFETIEDFLTQIASAVNPTLHTATTSTSVPVAPAEDVRFGF